MLSEVQGVDAWCGGTGSARRGDVGVAVARKMRESSRVRTVVKRRILDEVGGCRRGEGEE